jgi:hypothetical protein
LDFTSCQKNEHWINSHLLSTTQRWLWLRYSWSPCLFLR